MSTLFVYAKFEDQNKGKYNTDFVGAIKILIAINILTRNGQY